MLEWLRNLYTMCHDGATIRTVSVAEGERVRREAERRWEEEEVTG
ncbi:hypothetical protein LCGC14_1741870 [marine sediment metagenome]|uniref:Uncharacterized protein n=1 Tax=marine sediment metagenome TaxID=412755 RepID=A0A0F9JLN5_9ZZZZ